MNPTRTEAIKRFLIAKTITDLAMMYHHDMEVQVNVAQDGGERVSKEFKGREYQAYTDHVQTWKPLRIPYKANSDPEYTDVPMSFDLSEHAEGIGMTGWNWIKRCSMWVAYDFDAIIGHSVKHMAKLTNEELQAVQEAAFNIPWVTIRKSTSGSGLHLYVMLAGPKTMNHNEHAALARAILGKMSALTGFDFHSHVDICGGNMWVWHRKMEGTDGLELVKQGTVLTEIPPNWRDHIKVVQGKRRKNLPKKIEEMGKGDSFEELTGQRPKIKFDPDHQRLIDWLEASNAFWWWDQDHHMLVTHSWWLQKAHEELALKGCFITDSKGTNTNEQNVYAFPIRRGGWTVRRYTPGVQEHASWTQDGAGWTRCYLNREPDLGTACRSFGGVEDTDGSFEFMDAESAIKVAQLLGVHINIDIRLLGRRTMLKQHKDGRLVVMIKHEKEDRGDKMGGWKVKKSHWQRIFSTQITSPAEPDTVNQDDLLRKMVVQGAMREDAGWTLRTEGEWSREPVTHMKFALESLGYTVYEVKCIMGAAVLKPWKIVNKPFEPEYPGDREWNQNAAQLKYVPTNDKENLHYPTWMKILEHCGSGLDDAIKLDPWCKANSVLSGADWLKIWVASVFQFPYEPLPYLFFYGPEDTGKSSFHQALQLLLTRGYTRGDAALTNTSGFNGEIDGALLCIVEETDLRRDKQANRRIKDWVLAPEIMVSYKNKTPFMVKNTTKWIQCNPKTIWIQTSEGPKQIRELINQPVTIMVHGKAIKTEGFFRTGKKQVYRVTTEQGYSFDATSEHPALKVCDDFTFWTPISKLKAGDELLLSKHRDLEWPGLGTFDEGYVLGWLVGDGSFRRKNDPILYFYGGKDQAPLRQCAQILDACNILTRKDGASTIAGKQLQEFCDSFGLESKTVDILEDTSSDFYAGFLAAFFDADGSCIYNECTSVRRVTLYQSDLSTLRAVQRMLLRFGMTSSILKCHNAGTQQAPQGIVKSKASYSLSITNRHNLKIFHDRIPTLVHAEKLAKCLRGIKQRSKDVRFIATVKEMIPLGIEDVYDITVPDHHYFDGNGFVLHNCDNDFQACPVFPGDTRITMCFVGPISPLDMIPRKRMVPLLQKEAPDFLAEILSLEIPESNSRLNVPIISTREKAALQRSNQNDLELFIEENCDSSPGQMISVSEFYNKFYRWLDPADTDKWSKVKMGRMLPPQYPKGRRRKDGHHYVGNIWWKDQKSLLPGNKKLVLTGVYLESVDA